MIDIEDNYFHETFHSLHSYVSQNGVKGLDPRLFWYFPAAKLYYRRENNLTNLLRHGEVALYTFFPEVLRPYLWLNRIPSVVSPYGLGLFLQAYARMYRVSYVPEYLKSALVLANQLESYLTTTASGYLGVSNPLEDHQVVNLPAGSEVAAGFIELYLASGQEKFLNISHQIAKSFANDFQVKKVSNRKLVLDYTSASDGMHVLNANALAASTMASVSVLCNVSSFDDLIVGIVEYIAGYIGDRTIPYAGIEDKSRNRNWQSYDVYHTGFTLRGLKFAANYCGMSELEEKIIPHIEYMRRDFLNKKRYIQVLTTRKVIDIHGVAEYIRTVAELDLRVDDLDLFVKNIEYMRNGDTFYYKRGYRDVAIYMPRWGHAPMMLAIATVLSSAKKRSLDVQSK